MPKPLCQAGHKDKYELHGFIRDRIENITGQWLLTAPIANPGMLEMFRDRDAPPMRDLVPWAGEFAGKYLTASVQILKITRDKRLKKLLSEFVPRLISYQAKDGYLGPWPKNCRLSNFSPYLKRCNLWDTWGHYHIMLGLLFWYEQTRDKRALKTVCSIGDLICRKYLGKKKKRLVDTGWTEMNLAVIHSLCLLYRQTSVKRYLDMALQIVEEFGAAGRKGPLAGDYLCGALNGKEFFQMPKPRWESLHPIMGIVELYWITGDERFRRAFEHHWWSITKLDRHNNGGFTSGEKATGNPFDKGAIETCCTIAWIAMSVEMLKLTANPVVADEIELSTWNSVTGMHSSSGRWATYNTPSDGFRRASGHHIGFQSRPGSPELNCCSVNSPRGFGMISDWAVMRDRQGILLNYYGGSEMTVKMDNGTTVKLTQKTDYPASGLIHLEVSPSRIIEFTLKLRIPCWSKATKAAINGKPVEDIVPGSYLAINRRWQKGDKIKICLDMSLHYWSGEKDCKGLASIYRGPLLLAFDHRYNLELSVSSKKQACVEDLSKPFDRSMLKIPELDARALKCKQARWNDWLPPFLLLEVKASNGKPVRLCDFGSAGTGGTPYVTWLPVKHSPGPVEFSRAKPLRNSR